MYAYYPPTWVAGIPNELPVSYDHFSSSTPVLRLFVPSKMKKQTHQMKWRKEYRCAHTHTHTHSYTTDDIVCKCAYRKHRKKTKTFKKIDLCCPFQAPAISKKWHKEIILILNKARNQWCFRPCVLVCSKALGATVPSSTGNTGVVGRECENVSRTKARDVSRKWLSQPRTWRLLNHTKIAMVTMYMWCLELTYNINTSITNYVLEIVA